MDKTLKTNDAQGRASVEMPGRQGTTDAQGGASVEKFKERSLTGRQRVIRIIELLEQEYPQADTELKYSSLFELLIAVILSAQSTDKQVNKVTAKLFTVINQAIDFANIDLEELEGLIKEVGLYKNKAKNIKQMSKIIVQEYKGQVPDSFEDLLKLPGVGRKTANVMLAVGFDKPGLAVDTHVQRLANRLGLAKEKNPEKTELVLKKLIPEHFWSKSHHLLIHHGRNICKARKTRCEICILDRYCKKCLD